jgi:Uma2 family endonuclease
VARRRPNAPTRTYTYAEFLAWPTQARWELIGGEPRHPAAEVPPFHDILAARLAAQLDAQLPRPARALHGPIDVRLPEGPEQPDGAIRDVVRPDVFVIDGGAIQDDLGIRGAPRLVMEVTIPTTRFTDDRDKPPLYAHHGVREYWIVDPVQRLVTIYVADSHGRFLYPAFHEAAGRDPLRTVPNVAIDWDAAFEMGFE